MSEQEDAKMYKTKQNNLSTSAHLKENSETPQWNQLSTPMVLEDNRPICMFITMEVIWDVFS